MCSIINCLSNCKDKHEKKGFTIYFSPNHFVKEGRITSWQFKEKLVFKVDTNAIQTTKKHNHETLGVDTVLAVECTMNTLFKWT